MAPDRVIACSADLWQLRSHRAIWSRVTLGHQDDAVGGRRAVGDVIGAVRTEHACRIAFAGADRAAVIQQRAQFADRDRKVGAQQVLAEELEEGPAGRMLQEGDAAGMAGRVPGIFVRAGRSWTSAPNIGGRTVTR